MLVGDAKKKGAKVITGGKVHSKGEQFYHPTLMANINLDMEIAKQEIFGPVAPIIKFNSEDEVLALANSARVGLAGKVFFVSLLRFIDKLIYRFRVFLFKRRCTNISRSTKIGSRNGRRQRRYHVFL